jgi:TetR/AcrR family transcriptional regulator, transcriptional repressor for nem operon
MTTGQTGAAQGRRLDATSPPASRGGDTARSTGRPIREDILDSARELAQTVGFEAFSYADLAERVGIRSASIHHHFRYKHDLVAELLLRYRLDFAQRVNKLNAIAKAADRLVAYARLFTEVAAQGRMCLCGMSAAEWSSIGDAGQDEVTTFLSEQRAWLTATLSDGLKQGVFLDDLKPGALAEVMLVALEGALLLARAGDQTPDATTIMQHLLRTITASPARPVKVSRR